MCEFWGSAVRKPMRAAVGLLSTWARQPGGLWERAGLQSSFLSWLLVVVN